MRILVAPDSFKGSLTALGAASGMRRGVERALGSAVVDSCPLADGGEGTVDVIVRAVGGERRHARVNGPLGEPVDAEWALLAGGRTAVVEMAQAAGIALVPEGLRDPTCTTTYGVGQLVREALDAGVSRIIVGVGGSATTDGGAGALQALGVGFEGGSQPMTGGQLRGLRSVDLGSLDPRLARTEVLVACDVDHPLFGPDGAARVFGPQKGATPEQVEWLDQGLAHLASLTDLALATEPGAGAAGGLAFGLRACCGARMVRGIDLVFSLLGFEDRVAQCDLVLTGEGRIDAQSLRGKVVGNVARKARSCGVPVVALVGQRSLGQPELRAAGIAHCFALCDHSSLDDALAHPSELLAELAAEAVQRVSGC
jgi:glycerate 2-kinase